MTNIFSLDCKTIIISGGYGYLGKYMTKALASVGAEVFVLGRNKKKFDAAFLTNSNISHIYFIECDVTNESEVENAFKRIYKQQKMIHCIINNAALNEKITNRKLPLPEEWQEGLRKNVAGAYNMIFEMEKYLNDNVVQKIINISSMYGAVSPDISIYNKYPDYFNQSYYGAAKSGIIQLTKYYATYFAKNNTTVNCIAPGPFPSKAVQEKKGFLKELEKRTLLGRVGSPEDLDGVTIFLASRASDYMTGQTLYVDGGWTVR